MFRLAIVFPLFRISGIRAGSHLWNVADPRVYGKGDDPSFSLFVPSLPFLPCLSLPRGRSVGSAASSHCGPGRHNYAFMYDESKIALVCNNLPNMAVFLRAKKCCIPVGGRVPITPSESATAQCVTRTCKWTMV